MIWTWAHAIIIGCAIPAALYFFFKAVDYKYRLLKSASASPDSIDGFMDRIKSVVSIFLAQKKIFQEFRPGVMHAVIFWGFCILLVRSVNLFAMAFAGFDFELPLLSLNSELGQFYSFVKDITNVSVALMVLYALFRRYILRIPRLLNTGSALFVLLMIFGLMISDIIFEGALHSTRQTGFTWTAPAASLTGLLLFSPEKESLFRVISGQFAYFFHTLGILGFLVYLPAGKHMHIVTSLFNVFLTPLKRSGRLVKLDLEDETIDSFGVTKIEDYSWKDFLDLYTCTECGRCNDACPAKRTGKKLAPREISLNQKHFLMDEEAQRLISGKAQTDSAKPLVPDVVSTEEIWACTTCQSCEQACPVNIMYVQRINSLRRSEVLMKGQFPAEMKRIFKGMETNSNPWGLGSSTRLDWAKDLNLPIYSKKDAAEYLLYLGCAASFDDRVQKVSRALILFLRQHNISFAVLGTDESCCGETARRLGEEALGQTLIAANVDLFKQLEVKKILTLCPHCFNTFKNEYPDFGGNLEVIHHSQLIAALIRQGKVRLRDNPSATYTIHDSCYLGRINHIYEPSRMLVRTNRSGKLTEPDESQSKGFCCGGGGGMFWLEESGDRINAERFRQLVSTGASVITTSCPYCLSMLEDASKTTGNSSIQIKDMVELVMEN